MRKPPAIGELRHRGLEDLAAVLKGAKLIEAGAGRREDNRISGARQVHGRGEPRVQGLHTGHGAGFPKRRGKGSRIGTEQKGVAQPRYGRAQGGEIGPLGQATSQEHYLIQGPQPPQGGNGSSDVRRLRIIHVAYALHPAGHGTTVG